MSDSGDPEQDNQRELEAEREFYESDIVGTPDPAGATPMTHLPNHTVEHYLKQICYEHWDCEEPDCLQKKVNNEAKAALKQLIEEAVIGEDEKPDVQFGPNSYTYSGECYARNQLRATQREAITKLFN